MKLLIFGGIVALNREVDKQTAEVLHTIFLEIVIAPSFSQEALDVLTAKKNLRLLTLDVEADLGKKRKAANKCSWRTACAGH